LTPLSREDIAERRSEVLGQNWNSREEEFPLESCPLGSTTNRKARPPSELLVAIKLVDDIANAQKVPDSEAWVEWIRNAPPEAGEIEINLKEPTISKEYKQESPEAPPPYGSNTKSVFALIFKESKFRDDGTTRSKFPSPFKLLSPELLQEGKIPYYELNITLLGLRCRRNRFVSRIFFWLWMLLLIGPVLILSGFEILPAHDVPRTVTLEISWVFVLMSTELWVILSEVTRVKRHEIILGTATYAFISPLIALVRANISRYCAVLCVFASRTQVSVLKVFIIHVKTHILRVN
jgi:hypothetical protein